MKRNEIEVWLTNNGWVQDKWGHFHATRIFNNEAWMFRIKMQATSCRYEIKTNSKEWLNFRNDYYKNCVLLDGDLIIKNFAVNSRQRVQISK